MPQRASGMQWGKGARAGKGRITGAVLLGLCVRTFCSMVMGRARLRHQLGSDSFTRMRCSAAGARQSELMSRSDSRAIGLESKKACGGCSHSASVSVITTWYPT